MSSERSGAFAEKPDQWGGRQTVSVMLHPGVVLVGETVVESRLQIPRDTTLKAGRAFVKELFNLSHLVDANLAKAQAEFEPNDSSAESKLQEALRLDPATSLDSLDKLREVAAPLRNVLSREMVNAFRSNGFLRAAARGGPGGEEPALTFVASLTDDEARAPVLWDMMYEGQLADEPEWQNFWGFRVPIAHWVFGSRPKTIKFKHVLSAINEKLQFAGREVEELLRQSHLKLTHHTLRNALEQRVRQELAERFTQNVGNVEAWWRDCQPQAWLNRFLALGEGDQAGRKRKAELWKRKALVSVFKDSRYCYDLIHFACHCKPSQATQFLSRLDMEVAGEPLSLEVALVASDLARKVEGWSIEDPGPLVFLNACGTSQPSDSHEPPGFPGTWIQSQGALAVVATLCPVPDYFAYAFARKFYETLREALEAPEGSPALRNRYVAEAFLATRRYFMEEPYNNPLGLAYVLYATPGAYVLADFLPAGGAP
jgi:hypothetical protein